MIEAFFEKFFEKFAPLYQSDAFSFTKCSGHIKTGFTHSFY
jgi:hypothetical protein